MKTQWYKKLACFIRELSPLEYFFLWHVNIILSVPKPPPLILHFTAIIDPLLPTLGVVIRHCAVLRTIHEVIVVGTNERRTYVTVLCYPEEPLCGLTGRRVRHSL